MSDEALPLVPRFDTDLGRYLWEPPAAPAPAPAPIEPAFIHQAMEREFEPTPYIRSDVTTFADAYPRGTKGSLSLALPAAQEAKEPFDPLADWRVEPAVADDVLLSLPEHTPRVVRALLTLLMGAMRYRKV